MKNKAPTTTIWTFASVILIAVLGVSSIAAAQVGTWTKKADMPTVRSFLSASGLSGLV